MTLRSPGRDDADSRWKTIWQELTLGSGAAQKRQESPRQALLATTRAVVPAIQIGSTRTKSNSMS